MTKKQKLAIIGYGRFGSLLSQLLIDSFELYVFDTKQVPLKAGIQRILDWSMFKEMDIIILAIPIVYFEDFCQKIAGYLKQGSCVLDVLSVKVYAYRCLNNYLHDSSLSILPTHPMFGPDSFKHNKGFQGLSFILCPEKRTRHSDYQFWTSFLTAKGLHVVTMDCDTHDKITAKTLGLTQLLGYLVDQLSLDETEADTYAYKKLLNIVDVYRHDGLRLLKGLYGYNPYMITLKKDLITILKNFNQEFLRYEE